MNKYMAIDLTLLAAIMCVLEGAAHLALTVFPTEAFAFSIVLPVTLIVMMRWGWWGVLHAMLGGLVYSLLNGGNSTAVAAYMIGNAFVIVNQLWFRRVGKSKVRNSVLLTLVYTLTGFVLMTLGRAVAAAAMETTPIIGLWLRFFTTDALSCVMAMIILLIARRGDINGSVFQDQREYLAELAAKNAARTDNNADVSRVSGKEQTE